MGAAVNRGNNKVVVTVALVVLAILAALLLEFIGGSNGGASEPGTSSTKAAAPRLGASPDGTNTGGTAGSSASIGAGRYRTVGTNVNLRTGPSTSTAVITVLGALGSPVTLSCYLRGTSIGGDPWWYRATFVSARGYVAGYWVNTGPDPAKTHLPAC